MLKDSHLRVNECTAECVIENLHLFRYWFPVLFVKQTSWILTNRYMHIKGQCICIHINIWTGLWSLFFLVLSGGFHRCLKNSKIPCLEQFFVLIIIATPPKKKKKSQRGKACQGWCCPRGILFLDLIPGNMSNCPLKLAKPSSHSFMGSKVIPA